MDCRADICSFGYLLQEALTGIYPLGSNAILPGAVDPQNITIDATIIKCTEYEKYNRYESMDECLNALNIAFNGTTEEKKQLAGFYIACQELKFLAKHWTLSGRPLTAGVLKALYLNRFKFELADQERTVIFHNLLLQGKGTSHGQRKKRKNIVTPLNEPGSLGWFWFSNISKEEALERIRRAVDHQDIFVCAGALRALGRLGSIADASILREKITHGNARVVAEAIKGLALLGMGEDDIRRFKQDDRSEVRQAVAYMIGMCGSGDEDIAIILNFLADEDMMVRRAAVKALTFIAPKEIARPKLETVQNNPNETPQVKKAAQDALIYLHTRSFPTEDFHERNVKKIKATLDDVTKAWNILLYCGNFIKWDAAARWIAENESKERIMVMIKEIGHELDFEVLEKLDFYLYCPQWWVEEVINKR